MFFGVLENVYIGKDENEECIEYGDISKCKCVCDKIYKKEKRGKVVR